MRESQIESAVRSRHTMVVLIRQWTDLSAADEIDRSFALMKLRSSEYVIHYAFNRINHFTQWIEAAIPANDQADDDDDDI